MKNKLFSSQSSYIVAWPVMGVIFVLGILAAVQGWFLPAAVLIICAFVGLFARLWAIFSCRNLKISIKTNTYGVFPGDKLTMKAELINDKFLPVMWLELDCRLDENPVLQPLECSIRDVEEPSGERDGKTLKHKEAQIKLPALIWYEKSEAMISWEAVRRGIYSSESWSIVSGDGLGLCQLKSAAGGEIFAVYPKLQEVITDAFLNNLQNGKTGMKGLYEDVTVIRSGREYMPQDNTKSINWRMAARNLPLQVNIYEKLLPGSVHFVIDGESFVQNEVNTEKLEDMLSLIASITVRLADTGIDCGVTLDSGRGGRPVHIFRVDHSLGDVLFALAAYEPIECKMAKEGADECKTAAEGTAECKTEKDGSAECKTSAEGTAECKMSAKETAKEKVTWKFGTDIGTAQVHEMLPFIGRVYFVTLNAGSAAGREEILDIPPSKMSIITYEDGAANGDYATLCLKSMKGGSPDEL